MEKKKYVENNERLLQFYSILFEQGKQMLRCFQRRRKYVENNNKTLHKSVYHPVKRYFKFENVECPRSIEIAAYH